MVRIGLIGFGQQGKLYSAILTGTPLPGMPAIPKPDDCVLTAISARNEACKGQIEAMGVRYFQNWQDLVASDVCDAVVITVPHFSHHEIAIGTLNAGKHVLCEKPMTVRADHAQAILDAQQANPGTKLAMMLNLRANSMLQKLKGIIDSGELGTMRNSYYITNNWWRPDSYYASNSWRGTWSGEGGGILVNQACHPLDIWLWLCGMPQSVYACCKEGAHRNITVENDVMVMARYENGSHGMFTSCSLDLLGTDRLEIAFDKGNLALEGNRKATILRYAKTEREFGEIYDFRSFGGVLARDPESIRRVEELSYETAFTEDYVAMFENFADYVRGTGAPIASVEDGLNQVRLTNAIQLSSWTGKEIELPCDTEAYDRWLARKMREEKEA